MKPLSITHCTISKCILMLFGWTGRMLHSPSRIIVHSVLLAMQTHVYFARVSRAIMHHGNAKLQMRIWHNVLLDRCKYNKGIDFFFSFEHNAHGLEFFPHSFVTFSPPESRREWKRDFLLADAAKEKTRCESSFFPLSFNANLSLASFHGDGVNVQ